MVPLLMFDLTLAHVCTCLGAINMFLTWTDNTNDRSERDFLSIFSIFFDIRWYIWYESSLHDDKYVYCILLSIYIYTYRTQLTLVLIGTDLVLEGWPSKIEVSWVLGMYWLFLLPNLCMSSCLELSTKSFHDLEVQAFTADVEEDWGH